MFSRNVKYLRKKYGITQEELANQLGYRSFVTISKWESGDSRPQAEKLQRLATILHVSVDDLLNKDLTSNRPYKTEKVESVRIKVLGSVPAGIPIEAIEDVTGYEDIPIEWTSGGREYFGLKVKGDSMFPKYVEGDTIILRKQSCCESGQDCVVYVNGHEATLKMVTKTDDGVILQPLNPAYNPRFYRYDDEQNPVTICGVVVELRRPV